MADESKIVFLASLPPIMSAVRFSGDGSVRLQLDVPESERANVVPLVALNGVVLRVTVEIQGNTNRNLTELDDATEQKTTKEPRRLGRRGDRN